MLKDIVMETLDEVISKYFTDDMRDWYKPCTHGRELYINYPAFINIREDDCFEVLETHVAIRITNCKVAVTLFKQCSMMHVTVY